MQIGEKKDRQYLEVNFRTFWELLIWAKSLNKLYF